MSASEPMAVAAALPGDLGSRLDRGFGLALEIGTALLVAAEVAILFVGIDGGVMFLGMLFVAALAGRSDIAHATFGSRYLD